MNSDSDFALAKLIADKLKGSFWQVTVGEWWVVVEGVSRQKLVILTNDPFGVCFTPRQLTIGLEELRMRVMGVLQSTDVIHDDGSWKIALAS